MALYIFPLLSFTFFRISARLLPLSIKVLILMEVIEINAVSLEEKNADNPNKQTKTTARIPSVASTIENHSPFP